LLAVCNAHLHNCSVPVPSCERKHRDDIIPANSDIRCYALRSHNTHNVTRVVTSGNAPPTPGRGRVVNLENFATDVPSGLPTRCLRIRVV
jgi:hypothetical protein